MTCSRCRGTGRVPLPSRGEGLFARTVLNERRCPACTVYVDPLRAHGAPRSRFPTRTSCHLYGDSLERLHAFAASIGLRREWFQDRQDFPHYALTPSRRRRAVRAGAVEVDWRHPVGFAQQRRVDRGTGRPS